MANFRFTLAAVLRLREATRDERRGHLAEALQAREKLEMHVADADRQITDLRRWQQAAAAPGNVDVDRLVATQRYEVVLETEKQALQTQAKMLEEEVQRRQETLVEADREVRVMEKLREHEHDRHRREVRRKENREMDEIASRKGKEAD